MLALPEDPTARLVLARVRRAQGRFEEAVREAEHARDLDPRSGDALAALAQLLLALDDAERAVTTLAEAGRRAPGSPYVLLVAAEHAAALGPPQVARAAAEKALTAARANPFYFLEREAHALVERLSGA